MQAILEEQHVREQRRPGASAHNERAGSALEYTNVYGLKLTIQQQHSDFIARTVFAQFRQLADPLAASQVTQESLRRHAPMPG
jgi:hypothetical protein